MKKKGTGSSVVENRRARYDYSLSDELTVGMVLSGKQVRAIRDHHAQLKGSFVNIHHGELYLENLTLGAEVTENIKLLATRRQIAELASKKAEKGTTIVPVKILTGGRHIKLVIAIGKGKREYDKREAIKKRDIDRGRY